MPVDVNLASVVQLQKILTDDLTNKVYQERLAHGNYKSWDDLLLRVKGLGKSKVWARWGQSSGRSEPSGRLLAWPSPPATRPHPLLSLVWHVNSFR